MSNDSKESAQYTPTPWSLLEGNRATTIYGPDEKGTLTVQVARVENEEFPREGRHSENAAFIVRAVNHYAQLVRFVDQVANWNLGAGRGHADLWTREQVKAAARALLAKVSEA